MYGTQAPFPVTALPQHPLTEENTYHGEIATRSQFVHTDGDCQLVMFGIDGNIYDKDGYLIADVDDGDGNEEDCAQCVEPGVMEMLAIPVPDHCGLYYILSAGHQYGWDSQADDYVVQGVTAVHAAVLDLTRENPYDTDRLGRLVTRDEILDMDYPELYDWMETLMNTSMYVASPNGPPDILLQAPQACKSPLVLLRAVRSTALGEDGYWLYASHAGKVVEYRVNSSGIHFVAAIPTYLDPLPIGMTARNYSSDATAIQVDNEVRLALTNGGQPLYAYPDIAGTSPGFGAVVMRFNAQTGALIGSVQGLAPGQDGYPDLVDVNYVAPQAPGPGQDGAAACAWLDNGAKLLVTGREVEGNDWVPIMAVYDMATATWDDILPELGLQGGGADDYVRSRAHRNTAPDGIGDAIYLPHPAGIAAITGVDNGNYAFTAAVPTVAPCIPPVLDLLANVLYEPRFINAQVAGDNSVEQYNRAECCTFRTTYEGYNGHTFPNIPGTYHWYPDDNPFGNCGNVLFTGDLIIPPDVTLFIHNMTLRFAPEARMIVRAKGYVSAIACYLTNEDCLGPRWPGIRVEGDPNDPLQSEILQGRLQLSHTTVDDAVVGVWCSSDDGPGHTGGIVRTYWSTFSNCIVGARIEQYHRIINEVEVVNKCSFNSTSFDVTLSWPDLQELPQAQIHLFDVNGVAVNRCDFSNVYPVEFMEPHQRGVGILSFDASYRCKGFGDYANNRFRRLAVGALNIWNDPLFANQVDGMHFDRNLVGLYDMGCLYSMVTNNRFTTMANTEPVSFLSLGMYIDQSAGYLVERNIFEDVDLSLPHEVHSVGIWFHGDQPVENRIYDNAFYGLTLGNVAEGVHHHTTGTVPPVMTGLQWLCNLYEGGFVDQFLLSPDGSIKQQQGVNNPLATAGNVFVGQKDCQTQYEPVVFADHVDEYVIDNVVVPYVVTYHYYAHDQSPDCRPECVEDENNIDITPTGGFYNLAEVEGALPFNPAQHCNGGILDAIHKSVQEHRADYAAKYAQLASAALACAGQLDNGERVEVLEAIKAEPAWPSHQLRGYLLARSPLSEEAIITAINRAEPMDPWHLTQVLIANSKLSDPIWAALDHSEALSPFFYQMVLDHQEDPSIRQILMEELALRAYEKDTEQRLLVLALHEDSTYTGKLDTLLSILSTDTLGLGRTAAYQLALAHGRGTEAAALAAAMAGDARFEQLLGLGALQLGLDPGWSQAGHNEVMALQDMAASGKKLGRGAAWGILYALGATDSLPTGLLPVEYRSARANETDASTAERPVVGAYPNPAKDRLMITWPAEVDAGTLEVIDARGRSVLSQALGSRTGFVELDVRGWADGLYLARVLRDGQVVGETKCAIAR
ncbi:MAG: T9SS type A sorting domain-containing protein [Flavobacteriales bacterium]